MHSYPKDIPKQQSCSPPEEPDIPNVLLSPKQRQALNTPQGTSPEPPWSSREALRDTGWHGQTTAPSRHRWQAPLYRGWDSLPGLTWRPPEPIHGRRRNVNKHGGLRDTWCQRQGRTLAISHARASRGSGRAAVTQGSLAPHGLDRGPSSPSAGVPP